MRSEGVPEKSNQQISRLSNIKTFADERKNCVFTTFVNFQPVERLKNGRDVSEFRGLNDSTAK